MKTYFAEDGSYGDALDILIIDTEDWPEWAWDALGNCSDFDRLPMAADILTFLTTFTITYDSPLFRYLLENHTKVAAAAFRKDI